jgi:leader peptidase (prepilin peptidase)/N-methyltransferase
MILHFLFATLFGVCIGSFLSVCIHRIPRAYSFYPEEDVSEEEIPEPIGFNTPVRSICPHCSEQLLWWHNIPVVSWFLLRGRCYFCKANISFRYPFVELCSGLLCLLSLLIYGFTPTAILIYLVAAALLVVIFIDFDYYIIPDVISKPGIALGIIAALANHYFHFLALPFCQSIEDCIWGLLMGGGFLWLIAKTYLILRKRDGLGLGDVKLLYMVGAFFGAKGALTTIVIGSLLGSVMGTLILILSGMKLSHYIAFGPYLVMGVYLYMFLGEDAFVALIETTRALGALLH